jgi:hypothetical protein
MEGKRPKRHLYTPPLSEDNVRKLYQLAKARRMPMTRLLNQLVRQALQTLEHEAGAS